MRALKKQFGIISFIFFTLLILAIPMKVSAGDYPTLDDAEAYIRALNLTDDLDIYREIVKFCAVNYDYNARYSSVSSMIEYGGGDCWASTAFILEMCKRFDIEAVDRAGNKDYGAGDGHRNVIARINGTYYIGEAGYVGSKPRVYSVKEEPGGFMINSQGVLLQYDGFEENLIIPEIINGITVRKIGAIPASSRVSQSILGKMKTVYIPKTVEEIIPGAFWGCGQLEAITVDEENPYFMAKDGNLYTKDEKKLLAIPHNCTSINIAEGTEVIGAYSAYSIQDIDDVIIPEGVKIIEENAFGYTFLKYILLPKSLTKIEDEAFFGSLFIVCMAIPKGTEIGEKAIEKDFLGQAKFYTDGDDVEEYILDDFKGTYKRISTIYNGVDYSSVYNYFDYSAAHYEKWKACNGDPDEMIADWYENEGGFPLAVLSNVSTGVKIQWNAVDGADSYRIFRKAEGDTSFVGVKKTKNTEYIDKGVEPGKTYSYYIRCINSSGKYFGKYDSHGVSIKTPAQIKADVSLEKTSKGVKISWSAVDGAVAYRIFKKSSDEAAFSGIKKSSSTEYTDKTVESGKTYFYYVRCIDANGKYIGTFDAEGESISIPAEIKADITIQKVSKGLKISWNPIDGVASYRIFKKESGDVSFTGVKKITGTEYTDKAVDVGKTYFYYVRCIDENGKYVGTYDTEGKRYDIPFEE